MVFVRNLWVTSGRSPNWLKIKTDKKTESNSLAHVIKKLGQNWLDPGSQVLSAGVSCCPLWAQLSLTGYSRAVMKCSPSPCLHPISSNLAQSDAIKFIHVKSTFQWFLVNMQSGQPSPQSVLEYYNPYKEMSCAYLGSLPLSTPISR